MTQARAVPPVEGLENHVHGEVPEVKVCVNLGEEDQMEIQGYSLSKTKLALTLTGCLLTGGVLLVLFYWKPEWKIYCTHNPCPLEEADTVILQNQYKQLYVESVRILTADGKVLKLLKPFLKILPGGTRQSLKDVKVHFSEDGKSDKRIQREEASFPLIRYKVCVSREPSGGVVDVLTECLSLCYY